MPHAQDQRQRASVPDAASARPRHSASQLADGHAREACAHRVACLARPLELRRRAFAYLLDLAARGVCYHRHQDAVETVMAVRRGVAVRRRDVLALVQQMDAFLAVRQVCLARGLRGRPAAKDIVGQSEERRAFGARELPRLGAVLTELLDARARHQERRAEPERLQVLREKVPCQVSLRQARRVLRRQAPFRALLLRADEQQLEPLP